MDSLERLIHALCCLPGIGPKSAQRMAYYLLRYQRARGLQLASYLTEAMNSLSPCARCNNYTEYELCTLCQDITRDPKVICVIEHPWDIRAIEQSSAFNGGYFVLMGKISPIDGLGPDEIGLPMLQKRVISEGISEVILALTPSVESNATLYFIQALFKTHPVKISQLAHGIPSGGTLELLDANTISSALRNRETHNAK